MSIIFENGGPGQSLFIEVGAGSIKLEAINRLYAVFHF